MIARSMNSVFRGQILPPPEPYICHGQRFPLAIRKHVLPIREISDDCRDRGEITNPTL